MPLCIHVQGVNGGGAAHEQTVALGPTETDIGAGLRQANPPQQLAFRVPHGDAGIADIRARIAAAPEIAVDIDADAVGPVELDLLVDFSGADTNLENNFTYVLTRLPGPDLSIGVVADGASKDPGDAIDYTITVTNVGDVTLFDMDSLKAFYIDGLKQMKKDGALWYHMLTTPVIEVSGDGKTARGIWMSFGNVTGAILTIPVLAEWEV